MKAPAVRPYRCLCEECEPLPPIEGLQTPPQTEEAIGARNLLKSVAQPRLSPQSASSR